PTSTAADLGRCVTLTPALCLPGKLLSQFLATERPFCQVRTAFPAAESCHQRHPARGLEHLHGGVRRNTWRPECYGQTHVHREPAARSTDHTPLVSTRCR